MRLRVCIKPFLLMLILILFLNVPTVKGAITWDLLIQNWNSIAGWTKAGDGTSDIDPAGQFRNIPDLHDYVTRWRDIGSLPGEYTVEFLLKIDSFGTGDGFFRTDFYDGEHLIQFIIKEGYIGYYDSSVTPVYLAHTTNNTNFNTWRLICDSDSDSFSVYENGTFVTTFTDLRNYAGSDGTVYASLTENPNGKNGAETHTDYLRIASGLQGYPFYLTFYHNAGGILRVDNSTVANSTVMEAMNNTVLELVAIVEGNLTYGFNNFTYNSNYNISNPYNLTVTGNLTVWCYFGVSEAGYSWLPLAVFTGLVSCVCVVIAIATKS